MTEQNLLHHCATVNFRQLVNLAAERHAKVADFLRRRLNSVGVPVQNLSLCGGRAGFLIAARNQCGSGGIGHIRGVWDGMRSDVRGGGGRVQATAAVAAVEVTVMDRGNTESTVAADAAVDAFARDSGGRWARAKTVTVVLKGRCEKVLQVGE